MKNIKPKKEVPELIVNTVNGFDWNLREEKPENFTLIVFYRGIHCPICKLQLEDLNSKIEKFKEKGVNVIAISANNKGLAQKTVEKWEVDQLTIGHDFSIDDAQKWDLYISEKVSEVEPEVFFEPGMFLINPDNTLYGAATQSMPFARPRFSELLKSLDFILEKDYPARGGA